MNCIVIQCFSNVDDFKDYKVLVLSGERMTKIGSKVTRIVDGWSGGGVAWMRMSELTKNA